MLCLCTWQRGQEVRECGALLSGLGGRATAPLQGAVWTQVKGLGLIQRGWWEVLICFFKSHWKKKWWESNFWMSCLTLCDPMDCSPPSSSAHGMRQARILERVAISFSRGYSQSRDWTQVSCIAGRFFADWATGEAQVIQHLKKGFSFPFFTPFGWNCVKNLDFFQNFL